MRLDEHLQILPRLERRDGEDVRRAEIGRRTVGAVDVLRRGVRDPDPLGRDAERRVDVASRVRRVHEDDVARRGGVSVLAAVHRARPRGRPLGMVERHEVVDRRRTHAGALRRVHPVREVQRVERAEEALRGGTAEPAPGRADRVRGRAAARCAARRRSPSSAARIRSGPRRLVGANATISCSPCRGLGEPGERAPDVVPDPERADASSGLTRRTRSSRRRARRRSG